MRDKKVKIFILLAICFSVLSVSAQNKAAVKKAPQKAVVHEKSQYQVLFEEMLESTAKITIVDSFVVDKKQFFDLLPLSSSCGKISQEQMTDTTFSYSYTNEYETLRFISLPETSGNNKLYMQHRLGRLWDKPEPVTISEDFTDIVCPYLLQDGVTLYFAAKSGEGNFGGYDLYFTVYNAETNTFYNPQNLGLPFNSYSDDIFYAIDETNNLGYLCTSRNQNDAKVCVYVFQPTESRELYEQNILDSDLIKDYALLSSISLTQTDKSQVDAVRKRFENAKKKRKDSANQNTSTASSPSRKLSDNETLLSQLRMQYHDRKQEGEDLSNLSKLIMSLEERVQQERKKMR